MYKIYQIRRRITALDNYHNMCFIKSGYEKQYPVFPNRKYLMWVDVGFIQLLSALQGNNLAPWILHNTLLQCPL